MAKIRRSSRAKPKSRSKESAEEKVEPLRIECPVCRRSFSGTVESRQPCVLICGHSFCAICTAEISRHYGECSICKLPFTCSSKNFVLIDCLEKLKEVKRVAKEKLAAAGVQWEADDNDSDADEKDATANQEQPEENSGNPEDGPIAHRLRSRGQNQPNGQGEADVVEAHDMGNGDDFNFNVDPNARFLEMLNIMSRPFL